MKRRIVCFLSSILMVWILSIDGTAKTHLFCFVPGGYMGGGLRFDIGENAILDVALSAGVGDSGSTYSVYGDIFRGNWGVGCTLKKVTVNSNNALDINLQYAVEYNIDENIIFGISVVLINYDTTVAIDPNITIIPSIMPYIVIPF